MKIFRLFFMTIAVIGLTACSSDDDNNAVELTNTNLAGTYDVVFLEGSEVETDDSSGVVVRTIEVTGDTFTDAIFIFNADGTYSASGDYRVNFTITTTNVGTVMESEIDSFDETGNYSTNNANSTITLDGEVGDVTLFDGTNLYVTFEETDSFGGNTTVSNSEIRLVKRN